jgi:hypothetical protein
VTILLLQRATAASRHGGTRCNACRASSCKPSCLNESRHEPTGQANLPSPCFKSTKHHLFTTAVFICLSHTSPRTTCYVSFLQIEFRAFSYASCVHFLLNSCIENCCSADLCKVQGPILVGPGQPGRKSMTPMMVPARKFCHNVPG